MSEDAANFRDSFFCDFEVVKVAKSDVQDGTILGGVYVLSCKHLVSERLDVGLAGERKESFKDRLGNQILGEIEEEGGRRIVWGDIFPAKLGEAGGILSEEVFENEIIMFGVVDSLEFLPGWVLWSRRRREMKSDAMDGADE